MKTIKFTKETMRLVKKGALTFEQAKKVTRIRQLADKEAANDYSDYEFDSAQISELINAGRIS